MDERNEWTDDGRRHGIPADEADAPMGHVVVVPFGRRRAVNADAVPEPVEAAAESRLRHPSAGGRPSLRIDCGECAMEGTDACADCVMSFVVNREPGDALVVDAEEARAQRILAEAGLLPTLRHRRRAAGD